MYLRAPAKINLFLEVFGRRDDGYHDLRSVVLPVGLCDTVEITSSTNGIHAAIEAPALDFQEDLELPGSDDNLAVKAARALAEATGCTLGADIQIEKTIPVGAGMAGGSGNAAAALVGLNEVWDLGLSREKLAEIGGQIGCDIPSCVMGGPVLMEGRGELIYPIEAASERIRNEWWIVLINPGVSISTGDIYSRYSEPLTSAPQDYNNMRLALEKGDLSVLGSCLFNSLEPVVCRKYPLIRLGLDFVRDVGAIGASLSGTGGTFFALAGSREDAEGLAALVQKEFGDDFWTTIVQPLPDGVMVAQVTLTHSV